MISKNFRKKIQEKIIFLESKVNTNKYSVFELEADTTIPAEYILLMHFFGKINPLIEKKITKYLLDKQNDDGGWSLFDGGDSNLSTSVKSYYALKLAGISIESKKMILSRNKILELGGAENSNVFTRILLALFKQISWKTIPVMPIEIMRLPKWFPFHLSKISYWSRTVIVPLLIVMYKKPGANNPNNISIEELFICNPHQINVLPKSEENNLLNRIFNLLDKLIRKLQPYFSSKYKKKCNETAYKWVIKRLNGVDGLGGIFPAMTNSLIALSIDDENRFSKEIDIVRKSIDKLLVIKKNQAYCQPCLSPIWDTGWVGLAMLENNKNIDGLVKWLLSKEIKIKGDWSINRPNLNAGGWAFQFNNKFYPDVDDTALIGMLLHRYNIKKNKKTIHDCLERTRNWIIGMQSKNGGWGSFDADNTHYYLNYIPFADHGALLDPPTADVSARCLSFLAQLQNTEDAKIIKKGLKYILSEQEENGSWYGRWGTNYIYGTWSVLSALNIIDFSEKKEVLSKATLYLKNQQNEDGGWGEDGRSYYKKYTNYKTQSTPSQTAWATMGLIAAGELESDAVRKGITYLTNLKKFEETKFTAVGFPKVFYLKYHGYSKYFPLLAMSKFNNLKNSNSKKQLFGV